MEDNKNRNYDQEDRDYKDAPMTTDFEKSKLNNDPNQAHQENPEQFEEFSSDQPNIPTNNGTVANSGNIQDDTWNNEVDPDRDIDGNSNDPYPVSEPDDESDDDESDIEDEDLNEESDFEDDDLDDVENADVANEDLDDEDVDDADEMHREISELRF
jgi:hypothetical protein